MIPLNGVIGAIGFLLVSTHASFAGFLVYKKMRNRS
jgi:hypothetical protein